MTDRHEQHHWNQRDHKPPVLQYLLLALACAALAWILAGR